MEFTKDDYFDILTSLYKEKTHADKVFNINAIHDLMKSINHVWVRYTDDNDNNEHVPNVEEIKNMLNHLYETCYANLMNDLKHLSYDEFIKRNNEDGNNGNVYYTSSGGFTVTIVFYPEYKDAVKDFEEYDWVTVEYKYEICSKPRF